MSPLQSPPKSRNTFNFSLCNGRTFCNHLLSSVWFSMFALFVCGCTKDHNKNPPALSRSLLPLINTSLIFTYSEHKLRPALRGTIIRHRTRVQTFWHCVRLKLCRTKLGSSHNIWEDEDGDDNIDHRPQLSDSSKVASRRCFSAFSFKSL